MKGSGRCRGSSPPNDSNRGARLSGPVPPGHSAPARVAGRVAGRELAWALSPQTHASLSQRFGGLGGGAPPGGQGVGGPAPQACRVTKTRLAVCESVVLRFKIVCFQFSSAEDPCCSSSRRTRVSTTHVTPRPSSRCSAQAGPHSVRPPASGLFHSVVSSGPFPVSPVSASPAVGLEDSGFRRECSWEGHAALCCACSASVAGPGPTFDAGPSRSVSEPRALCAVGHGGPHPRLPGLPVASSWGTVTRPPATVSLGCRWLPRARSGTCPRTRPRLSPPGQRPRQLLPPWQPVQPPCPVILELSAGLRGASGAGGTATLGL